MGLLEYKVAFDYDNGVSKTKLLAHLASCKSKRETSTPARTQLGSAVAFFVP
jgi:hypothetical protein